MLEINYMRLAEMKGELTQKEFCREMQQNIGNSFIEVDQKRRGN